MQISQSTVCRLLNVLRYFATKVAIKYLFGFPGLERLDHTMILPLNDNTVKRYVSRLRTTSDNCIVFWGLTYRSKPVIEFVENEMKVLLENLKVVMEGG